MAYYKKMQPELMQIDFNFAAIGSVVNPDSDTVKCQGNFTTTGDYIALIFRTEDSKMHDYCAYETDTDFSGFTLSFSVAYTTGSSDIIHYDDKDQQIPLVIKYTDDSEKYVTMGFCSSKTEITGEVLGTFTGQLDFDYGWVEWDSEVIHWEADVIVGYEDIYDGEGNYIRTDPIYEHQSGIGTRGDDYVCNYVEGYIQPVSGSGIPYGADITADYNYNDQDTYTFDFDNLVQGNHPDNQASVSNTSIDSITIPFIPVGYTAGVFTCTGNYTPWCVTFNNWTLTGADLNEIPANKPYHPYKVAEGYDDEYYMNPKRLVETSYMLGYRDVMNLYIGASHYYNKTGTYGYDGTDYSVMYLDTTNGLNIAYSEWLKYYCIAMADLDYTEVVISVSMENLQMPEAWKQRLWNGDPGQTGWTPPTSFYSPCNTSVRSFITKVVNENLTIVAAQGLAKVLQLGEPWWWLQEFEPGDVQTPYDNSPYTGTPAAFYDDATKAAYLSEFGVAMPIWVNTDIELNEANTAIAEWLKGKLGDYSDFMKGLATSNNATYGVLFFPPSVLDVNRAPAVMQITNTPFDNWERPNLDYFQIEDYDWVVTNNPQHKETYGFPKGYLDYQPNRCHYFAGFAWDQFEGTIEEQWALIDAAAQLGLNSGFKYVYIWAGTQIRRDSWLPSEVKWTCNSVRKEQINHKTV